VLSVIKRAGAEFVAGTSYILDVLLWAASATGSHKWIEGEVSGGSDEQRYHAVPSGGRSRA
jgi:hypothetical protein